MRSGWGSTRGGSAPSGSRSAPRRGHLWATMRDPKPWLRCNVVYYGPLDFQSSAFPIDRGLADEFSALTYLRRFGGRIPPMLVVKAGRDANEGINESIDRFAAVASDLHADVRVVTYPSAAHGFDLGPRTRRAKVILRETLRFLRARLARPLAVQESCATRAERRSALRSSPQTTRRSSGSCAAAARAPSSSRTRATAVCANGSRIGARSRLRATACSRTTPAPPESVSTSTWQLRSRRFAAPARRTLWPSGRRSALPGR